MSPTTTTARSRPARSYNPQRSRACILAAARERFVRQGFEATTIREVAALAGVPTSLLYHHFRDKEDLFAEVQRAAYAPVLEGMSHLELADPPSREGVAAFLRGFFDVLSRHPDILRLNPSRAMLRNPRIREVEHGTMRLLMERGEVYLRRGIESGTFRPIEPRDLILAFHGMIKAFFVEQDFVEVLYGTGEPGPEAVTRYRDTLVDIALRTVFPDEGGSGGSSWAGPSDDWPTRLRTPNHGRK